MLRRLLLATTLFSAAWAAYIWITGGTVLQLGVLRVSSGNPWRPLATAAIASLAYAVLVGRERRHTPTADAGAWVSRLRADLSWRAVAGALALASSGIAIAWNAWTAGGADSYAYVTQADLWLQGSLRVPVPIAGSAPWPNALLTFTPLGYSATASGTAIAPATGPGLPLLIATLKALAGHAAGLLAAPLTAGLLVWMTFLIGRELVSDLGGAIAAWLLSTSPVFLFMAPSQMSDIPAASFWALATLLALQGRSLTAGITSSMAILIRPNLVPLAAVMGGWILWQAFRHRTSWSDALRGALAYAAGVVPACLMIGWLNASLFGSPLTSGYGSVEALFSVRNLATNLTNYVRWTLETQTPLLLVGALALGLPSTRVWQRPHARTALPLLAGMVITIWLGYAFYFTFDAWWFLRFLLPSWPALSVGAAAVLIGALIGTQAVWWKRTGVLAVVLAVGIFGIVTAARNGGFPRDEGERRYAAVADVVAGMTEPSSAVLTGEGFAGPIRYYGGRVTMRFDQLDEQWLDRSLEWLRAQGRPPYLLIEDWEIPLFTARFAAHNRAGRLPFAPILAYRPYGSPRTIYLFDPARPDGPTLSPDAKPHARFRVPRPAAPIVLSTTPGRD